MLDPEDMSDAARTARFYKLFGVSWGELEKQGINSDDYSHDHMRAVLRRARRIEGGMIESERERSLEYAFLWRGWIAYS